jgi:hypothetical protein
MDELVVKDLIDRLIDLSFAEDIGDGDHTTLSCMPAKIPSSLINNFDFPIASAGIHDKVV